MDVDVDVVDVVVVVVVVVCHAKIGPLPNLVRMRQKWSA